MFHVEQSRKLRVAFGGFLGGAGVWYNTAASTNVSVHRCSDGGVPGLPNRSCWLDLCNRSTRIGLCDVMPPDGAALDSIQLSQAGPRCRHCRSLG
jgi:hypothetical protein